MNGGVSTAFDEFFRIFVWIQSLHFGDLVSVAKLAQREIQDCCPVCPRLRFAHMLANTSTVDGAARHQHFWRRLVRSPTGLPN
jgi:hypothetical protein